MIRPEITSEMIDAVLNRISEQEESGTGSAFPGMTYEQGIQDAFDWLLNLGTDKPDEFPFADHR